ncbi:MAG TPA: hypothetical protein VJO54_04775 [Burkholderiales bacterium]|nr:hypothetical protein [Burkholderiales bacterium]
MEAVTSQSGSKRVRSLIVAVAASVAVAALVGLGASSGMFRIRSAPAPDEARDSGAPLQGGKPAPARACALCGTVESVRTVEVYDEPDAASGAVDAATGTEPADTGPGGAIAGAAASVLDSLSGAVYGGKAEKNMRKRLVWRVTLRMDDGSFRAVSLPRPPAFAVGEKVRVAEGRLVRE